MANELVVSGTTLTYSKTGAKITIPVAQLNVTISGTDVGQGIIDSTTADAALTVLPAAPGLAFLKNLDPTNYIQIGPDNTNYFLKLTPDRPWAILPINGTAIHHKANTATCKLQYCVWPV